jgi:hypothetical protein
MIGCNNLYPTFKPMIQSVSSRPVKGTALAELFQMGNFQRDTLSPLLGCSSEVFEWSLPTGYCCSSLHNSCRELERLIFRGVVNLNALLLFNPLTIINVYGNKCFQIIDIFI